MPRDKSGNNSPDPRETNPDQQRSGWLKMLADMDTRWNGLGLRRLWWIRRSDLSHRIKKLHESTPSDSLFSLTEQNSKRSEKARYLDNHFSDRLEDLLPISRWKKITRFFSSSRHSSSQDKNNEIERWRDHYHRADKSQEFESQYDMYLRKRENLLSSDVNSLFNNDERVQRLAPQIQSTRRTFRKHQERQLRRHTRYSKLINSLQEDELDEQLKRLGEEFSFIGRTREWYLEFEKLVDEVFDHIKNRDYGQNESVIRLLQNDFLLTMQGRFSTYWRYFELREFCFANNKINLINQISYFEKRRFNLQADNTSSTECDVLLKDFIRMLNTSLAKDDRHDKTEKNKKERILEVDHTTRLEEWANFKQRFVPDDAGIIDVFNHLRPILIHCPEWYQEFSVFRSRIKVKRLTNIDRKNSDAEIKDVRSFVSRLSERIDREITTDVSFRMLEQELIRDEDHLRDLDTARKQIALQRELRSINSAEKINEIKQEFVRLIFSRRAPDTEEESAIASVTPLFAKANSGSVTVRDRRRITPSDIHR